MASLKKTSTVKEKKATKPVAKKTVRKTAPAKDMPKAASVKKVSVRTASVSKPSVSKASASKKTVSKASAKKSVVKSVVKSSKKTPLKSPVEPSGIPEQLRDAALKVLNERQAEDIVTISLAGRSSVADYMIIASGRAGRQVVAISDYLREAFYKLGVKQVRIEGLGEANWVLVDGGDVIVHLFRPEVRAYYDLDSIWKGKRPPE